MYIETLLCLHLRLCLTDVNLSPKLIASFACIQNIQIRVGVVVGYFRSKMRMVKLNSSNLIYAYDFQVMTGILLVSLFFPLLIYLEEFILVTGAYQIGRWGLKRKFTSDQ